MLLLNLLVSPLLIFAIADAAAVDPPALDFTW